MTTPDIDALLRERLEIEEALKKQTAHNFIDTLYPDEGELRRELYTKHLQFFEAGNDYTERCMMAANRIGKCCTYNTLIETDKGSVKVGELYEGGKEFTVLAWDGKRKVLARAGAPFKKPGFHDCYRLTMSDGRWVEVADDHRVLTSDGWRRLSELLPLCGASHQASNSERDLSTRASDDQRSKEKPSSLRGYCFPGLSQYGEQLLRVVNIAAGSLQQLAGVQGHTRLWWQTGAQGGICTNSPQPVVGLLASLDDLDRCEDPFFAFADQNACTNAEWLFDSCSDGGPPPLGSETRPQSSGEECSRNLDIRRAWQLLEVDSNYIVSCEPIGHHEVYDFEVDVFHNYIAGGIVHHNTLGVGGYETALHLTGEYPGWWTGRRFDHPIDSWVAGETSETTRDIVQKALMGDQGSLGTGLLRSSSILGEPTKRSGVAGAMDTARIQHVSGGISILGFKSYDQGRSKFQGTAKHVIWLDEECPSDVYSECLLRLMTTNGILLFTFTPLLGLSDVALQFVPEMAPEVV